MATVVGVASEGDVQPFLDRKQALQRGRERRTHEALAIPGGRHEPELLVDDLADHSQLQAIPIGDPWPVADAGAAERIDADPDARAADRVEVEDVREEIACVIANT